MEHSVNLRAIHPLCPAGFLAVHPVVLNSDDHGKVDAIGERGARADIQRVAFKDHQIPLHRGRNRVSVLRDVTGQRVSEGSPRVVMGFNCAGKAIGTVGSVLFNWILLASHERKKSDRDKCSHTAKV